MHEGIRRVTGKGQVRPMESLGLFSLSGDDEFCSSIYGLSLTAA